MTNTERWLIGTIVAMVLGIAALIYAEAVVTARFYTEQTGVPMTPLEAFFVRPVFQNNTVRMQP